MLRQQAASAAILLASACSPSAGSVEARVAPDRVPPRTTSESTSELPGAWERVEPELSEFRLWLPDPPSWRRLDEPSDRWLTLRHPSTSSVLRLRSWKAPRSADPEGCEEQARLWSPQIPLPDAGEIVDTGRLPAPPGFDTHVTSLVRPRDSGLLGAVLAFGAAPGRCVAAVFVTEASGSGAAAAIGRRVAQVREELLPRLELRAVGELPKAR